jgi:hypothetical protein
MNQLNGAPTIRAVVEGRPRVILIDTGSSISLIEPGVSAANLTRTNITPYGVTGDELQLRGEQLVHFTVNGQLHRHQFYVCLLSTEADAIIGADFLYSVNAKLDMETIKLWLENSSDFNHASSERSPGGVRGTNDRPTLTVFSSPNGRGGQRACWIGHK